MIILIAKKVFDQIVIKMSFEKTPKTLNNIEVGQQSPRFGTKPATSHSHQPHKAGLYGQSQHAFIQSSRSHPVQPHTQKISKQELSKHASKHSAWISLKGIVYDVTAYIAHHPGGDVLIEGCGKESQKLFDENHSWVNARNILGSCVVGVLEHD